MRSTSAPDLPPGDSRRSAALRAAGVAGIVAAAYGASAALRLPPGNVAVLWITSGVLAVLLHALPRADRLAATVAGFVAHGIVGVALGRGAGEAATLAALNVAEAWATTLLLVRFLGPAPDLSSVPQVLRFAFGVVPAPALASAVLGAWIVTTFHPDAEYGSVLATWFVANGVGTLLVLGFALTHRRAAHPLPWDTRIVERTALTACLLATGFLGFTEIGGSGADDPLRYLLVAAFAWAGLRFGPASVTECAALLAAELIAVRLGGLTGPEGLLGAQGLLAATTVAALCLAAATAERKRAEEALAERRDFLERLLEAARAGSWDWDMRTDHCTYDARWASMLGYRVEELVPHVSTWRSLIHPDDLAAKRAAMEWSWKEGTPYEHLGRYRHKDGTWRWVLCRGTTLRDAAGTPVRMVGTHTDATSIRALSDSVRETAARFRAAVEGSLDPFFLANAVRAEEGHVEDLVIVWCNRLGAKLLGRTVEDTMGRKLSELAPSLALDGSSARWQRALADGRALTEEIEVHAPEIRAEHLHVQVVPLGEGIAITLHDLTERRRLQKQLLQAQKMEGMGRLAGGIAHDFNNLLTVIRGYAELARSGMPDDDPSRPAVAMIEDAADRAADLTGRLLTFARRSAVETKHLDLNDLVTGLRPILTRLVGDDVSVRVETSPAPAWIHADPGSLEQVLVNLAANARDAMPQGGRISIRISAAELTEDAARGIPEARAGSFVRLAFEDTGIGFTDEALQHLFEPFFTTKSTGRGTGLGLATSYGMVKQADGFIEVRSARGRGTEILVYLPVSRPPDARTGPVEVGPLPTGTGETILVTEDESGVRSFLTDALRTAGYHVLAAEHGNAALAASRRHDGRIHLLLTDVVMPGFRGPELAALLSAERPGIRVLYVSGFTAEAFGGDGGPEPPVLRKPFTVGALLARVREVLDAP